jgi:hypothetical protein
MLTGWNETEARCCKNLNFLAAQIAYAGTLLPLSAAPALLS